MVRYRRRQVLQCLAEFPHESILEVGCGMDSLVQYVDDWRRFTIVEPGDRFAERARSIKAARPFSVLELTIEAAATGLRGERFDFVVLSSLIHEVIDAGALLSAVHSLCDSNTVVHVNVPNARSLHNRLALKMGLIPDLFTRSATANRMQRTSTFDLATLAALARATGFSVLSSGSYFLKPFTNGQLQQMLDARIIDEAVLDGLFSVNDEFDGLGAEIFVNLRRT